MIPQWIEVCSAPIIPTCGVTLLRKTLLTITQRAIARYFSEEDLKYDGLFRDVSEKERTKTSAILRPQFWKGQQHGGRTASVHARHLRPLCETVSSGELHSRCPTSIYLVVSTFTVTNKVLMH